MSEKETHFERISFWELLKRYPVQIPVMQRDYAQGRPGNERVIDDFLDALMGAVTGPPVELDFIFGNGDAGPFRPLDGQQRLTTLFLLHWYAARVAGLAVEDYTATLSRFSYDTRVSSREFCEKLVNEAVAVVGVSKVDSLSGRIRDYPWFVEAWEYDPTVAGMLAVLDKLATPKDSSAVARWPDDLWSRLTTPGVAPITFSLVELERFGLTDDLYIKMNARGKALTAFENFKAILGARVVEEGWDAGREFEAQFGTQVDNRWTDFFWRFCPPDPSGLKQIDGTFLSFILHSVVCSMARDTSSAKKIADHMQELLNNPELLEAKEFTAGYYAELRERLEMLCEKPDALKGEARRDWEIADGTAAPTSSLVEEVLRERGPQYKRRLLLYAQMKLHAEATSVSEDNMADWRRVVRNVIAHSVVERPESFVSGVRLLDELAKGVGSIYEYLASTKLKSDFASNQVEEEQRKARLLVQHPEQRALLHGLEDSAFLRGRIAFALDCVNGGPDIENFDFEQLRKVASVISNDFGNGITAEIRRAFLTIGNGDFFRYWSSVFYMLELPKYCLIADDRDFRSFTESGHANRNRLKSFVLALIGKSCAQLIAEYQPAAGTPNWRTRLIREPDLILRATQHYIALDEANGVVYPIDGQRPRNTPETQAYLETNKIQ